MTALQHSYGTHTSETEQRRANIENLICAWEKFLKETFNYTVKKQIDPDLCVSTMTGSHHHYWNRIVVVPDVITISEVIKACQAFLQPRNGIVFGDVWYHPAVVDCVDSQVVQDLGVFITDTCRDPQIPLTKLLPQNFEAHPCQSLKECLLQFLFNWQHFGGPLNVNRPCLCPKSSVTFESVGRLGGVSTVTYRTTVATLYPVVQWIEPHKRLKISFVSEEDLRHSKLYLRFTIPCA